MEPSVVDNLAPFVPWLAVLALSIGLLGVVGWIYLTRMRMQKGYPLESTWGMPIHKKTDDEAMERIKLLSQENAQLRAELGSMKDRLANVERIVTDEAHSLTKEIDALRGKTN